MVKATTIQSGNFIGWYRPNRRELWRSVVEAHTEAIALDKLLREPPGDKIVLPAGRDPNEVKNYHA
jgi:hypothetical protein